MSAGRKYRRAIRRGGVAFVLPEIPDDASSEVKNAVAIRNAATRTGRCPSCGAEMEVVFGDIGEPGGLSHALMAHENDCPALLGGAR